MSIKHRAAQGAVLGLTLLWSVSAQAADPKGIWLDHTGRGAVQIKNCTKGKGLCGFVVYIKQAKYADRCGMQILGNVTNSGGGWIYSPTRGSRYTVRIKRLSGTRLRVVGNASSSFFSKTFTWKKAPSDLKLCGKYGAAQRLAASKNSAGTAKTRNARMEQSTDPIVPLSKKLDRNFERSTRVTGTAKSAANPPQSEIDELEASFTAKRPARSANAAPSVNDEQVNDVNDVDEDEADPSAVKPAGDPMEGKLKAVLNEFLGKGGGFTGGMKGRCKIRIPYVNRVINIPCEK